MSQRASNSKSAVSKSEGGLDATGMRVALVASRFNEQITQALLDGARDALCRYGVDPASLTVVWVPGAFELGLVAKRVAEGGDVDAVICVGAVIRGETAHFDLVAREAASGVARAAMDTGVPVLFGVLATETLEQAEARSGEGPGNTGFEVALGAIEMVQLLRQLSKGGRQSEGLQVLKEGRG